MRKEIQKYAKTVTMETPLEEVRQHVRNMVEFNYVFNVAQKNEAKKNVDKLQDKKVESMIIQDVKYVKVSIFQKAFKVSFHKACQIKEFFMKKAK